MIRILLALVAVGAVAAAVAWAVAPIVGVAVGVIAAITVLPVLVRRQET